MAAPKKVTTPIHPEKNREPATMLIRNVIPAEDFKKAYGKYNYAKVAK